MPYSNNSGGAGGGGLELPAGLLDGETLRFDYASGKMEGTGDINSDLDVNFTPKTLISGTGTLQLGQAHAIKSIGENVAFTNLLSGRSYHPLWQTLDDGRTGTERVRTLLPPIAISDISASLINPIWTNPVAATVNQTIRQVRVSLVYAVSNLVLELDIGGVGFYREIKGAYNGGFQNIVLDPPLDVKQGQVVTFRLTELDGSDLTIRGSTVIVDSLGRPIPYQEATISSWVDEPIAHIADISNDIAVFGQAETPVAGDSKTHIVVKETDPIVSHLLFGIPMSDQNTGAHLTYHNIIIWLYRITIIIIYNKFSYITFIYK